jgi:hypothetical protein
MRWRLLLLSFWLAGAAGASACGGDGSNDGGSCAADAKKDVYAPGLTKTDGDLAVRVVDAAPAPPAMGTNTLTLEVASADRPVDDAKLTVTPFMPAHGHGSGVDPVVTSLGGGRYRVADVYFMMPGTWTLTVRVERAGAAAREVVFAFCLEK